MKQKYLLTPPGSYAIPFSPAIKKLSHKCSMVAKDLYTSSSVSSIGSPSMASGMIVNSSTILVANCLRPMTPVGEGIVSTVAIPSSVVDGEKSILASVHVVLGSLCIRKSAELSQQASQCSMVSVTFGVEMLPNVLQDKGTVFTICLLCIKKNFKYMYSLDLMHG